MRVDYNARSWYSCRVRLSLLRIDVDVNNNEQHIRFSVASVMFVHLCCLVLTQTSDECLPVGFFRPAGCLFFCLVSQDAIVACLRLPPSLDMLARMNKPRGLCTGLYFFSHALVRSFLRPSLSRNTSVITIVGDVQRQPPQREARGPQRVQVGRHPYPSEGGEDKEVDLSKHFSKKPPQEFPQGTVLRKLWGLLVWSGKGGGCCSRGSISAQHALRLLRCLLI